MNSVNKIINEVDGIVDVELYSIGQIAETDFKSSGIKNIVDDAVSLYGKLKDQRYEFMEIMHTSLIKVDKFLSD